MSTLPLEVKHTDDGKHGKFYIEVDGKQEGEMVYTWAGADKFIIEHTQVTEKLKGLQAGKLMLDQAVKFARDKKVKILPLCPFANAMLHRSKDYQDILA